MDDMSRLNRLSQLWSWLPAFRAVAETEHLGEASQKVHTSASALSRAVQHLEEGLEVQLFDRQGRRLKLNDRGEIFLRAVRSAFRLLDDALEDVTSGEPVGTLYVGVSSELSWMCWPWIRALRGRYPRLDLHLTRTRADESIDLLLRGQIDLAVTMDLPTEHDETQVYHLSALECGVYCGPQHPMYDEEDFRIDKVAAAKWPFVAIQNTSTRAYDGWPRERRRRVEVRVDGIESAAHLCRHGGLLAALPKRYVEITRGHDLRLVDAGPMTVPPTFLVRRVPIASGDLLQHVLDVIFDAEWDRGRRGALVEPHRRGIYASRPT